MWSASETVLDQSKKMSSATVHIGHNSINYPNHNFTLNTKSFQLHRKLNEKHQ